MPVVRSALGGLLIGAAVGFAVALLRPRPRSGYVERTALR
jgi:gas vesicle protein